MVRAHVIIEGVVQGVFFRAHTRDQAKGYNLTGWVKNRRDGKVEAVFEGEEADVKKVLGWCHKGPSWSRVSDVQIEFEEYTGEFDNFSITYRI